MVRLKRYWSTGAVLALILAAIYLRWHIYGDLRLSIANNDTQSYVTSAKARPLSWEAFTGRRLFTTNLLYRLFRPKEGYEILVNGSAGTTRRQVQPTFAGMAVFQNLASILCWTVLTVIIAGGLKNRGLQILAALVITTFAFTPQLADWDSVLTSESLTFSLFTLQFGLLALLITRLFKDPEATPATIFLAILWLLTVFFWTFLKDGNLYTLVVDALAIGGLLAFKSLRRQKILFLILLGALASFFALGWATAARSSRSQIQLWHVYEVSILPSPARAEFMKAQGMPDRPSAKFSRWFRQHAQEAYVKFLLTHPGYVLTNYTRDSLAAFASGVQPYFTAPELPLRQALIPFGQVLHPSDPSPMLMDTLLLAGVWAIALKRRPDSGLAWAWLASWLYLAAHAGMFITVFGDAYALTRHALMATTMFRLFMWMFAIVVIELALLPGQHGRSREGLATAPATTLPG